jgi:hypothetical protein
MSQNPIRRILHFPANKPSVSWYQCHLTFFSSLPMLWTIKLGCFSLARLVNLVQYVHSLLFEKVDKSCLGKNTLAYHPLASATRNKKLNSLDTWQAWVPLSEVKGPSFHPVVKVMKLFLTQVILAKYARVFGL